MMDYSTGLREMRRSSIAHKNVIAPFAYDTKPARRPFPMPAAPVRRPLEVPRLVTTADIVRKLEVTTLAVNKWREGSSQREGLPYITQRLGKANRILIREKDLLTWLDKYRPDLRERWLS